jgi:hypothetical protein
MTRRKASNLHAGSDPKEEGEARIAAIVARLRPHRVDADIHQPHAGTRRSTRGPGYTQAGETAENNIAGDTHTSMKSIGEGYRYSACMG